MASCPHNSPEVIAKQRSKKPYVAPPAFRRLKVISDSAAARIAAGEPTDDDIAEVEAAKADMLKAIRERECPGVPRDWIVLQRRFDMWVRRERMNHRVIARALGVTPSRIQRWLRGLTIPTEDEQEQIRDLIG